MRPGRMKRAYTPINSAIGTVAAMVNVPHGLWVSAFTTIRANTEVMMIIIIRMPMEAMMPAVVPNSCLMMSPSDLPSRRIEINSTIMS